MRKIRSLIGMPVICRRRRIGHLLQAELSDDMRRMEGVWVDAGLRGTRYIPAEQLCMIGEMAVMADHGGQRKKCSARPIVQRAVSTDGSRIGAIVGAEVDEISFLVQSLELSRGFWDDLLHGRIRIETFSVQDGRIIVSEAAEASSEEVE